jgi:type IV pilus assembly protein PilO
MNLLGKKKQSSAGAAQWQAQFAQLNQTDPWLWPKLPQMVLLIALALLTFFAAWFFWLSTSSDAQGVLAEEETALRASFSTKLAKVNNLASLSIQRQQVALYVNQLEKQLPKQSEMDALLSDINQAGLGRGLRFELFRPGQVVVRDYYAELPIAIKVTGRYHDLGAFTADVAALSRIVTLHNLNFQPVTGREGILAMETTAKTFRYLDEVEIAAQKKAASEAAAKAGKS